MNTLRSFSIVAALGLASAVYAQSQTTPDKTQQPGTSDPSAASSPHQRDTTGSRDVPETSPKPPADSTSPTTTDPSAASSPHQQETTRTAEANKGAGATTDEPQVVGLEVISPSGEPLGAVVDVVMNSSGAPSYAVISSAGKATAVPYSTVSTMVRDNAVVMEQSRLQSAPKVEKGAWRDSADTQWQSESDRYWGKGGMRTATPGDADDSSMKKKKDRS
jgi:hypothetical protein